MELLSLGRLKPGMILAQDVYIESEPASAYLRRGVALSDTIIDRLYDVGVKKVYIDDGTYSKAVVFTPIVPRALRGKIELEQSTPAEKAPAASSIHVPTPPPIVQTAKHATVFRPVPTVDSRLRSSAISSLEHTFSQILVNENGILGSSQSHEDMEEVVDDLVFTITRDTKALVNISDLKSYDDYTYHHSLSVAVLSIAIGNHLGLSGKQLNQLGLAAILHDVGKTAVPVELIRKPSRLDEQEFKLVKTHSEAGSGYLISTAVGDHNLWEAVLCHHEKLDGTGYPNNLKENDIPLWSKIISVADVFDALTSQRPYRIPMQPADALEYIMGGIGTAFDYDIVQSFMRKLDVYPTGSCVQLSTGEIGLVMNNEMALRPVVEILGTGTVVDLYNDRQYLSVVIQRVIPEWELELMQEKEEA